MTFIAPSAEELGLLAKTFGLTLADDDIAAIVELSKGLKPAYDRIDELVEDHPLPRYSRGPGRAPETPLNPHNAWAWMSDIAGADSGPLLGCRVGIKDNISVAGQPMSNGSRLLKDFRPEADATVVSRILDAGGIIAGKTVCEDLCFSGGSHSSIPFPVTNPYDPTRSAGGSSSGNAAAIAAGDVTMCVGGDQGGSVRTPASWCGVVGLKPTHGLVPYTGAFPIEPSLDHLGPMGRSTQDVARLLAIIAGPDGLDYRQAGAPAQDYVAALESPLAGLRIGVVQEGFGRPESLAETDQSVRRALASLSDAGAMVKEISIPWHIDGYYLCAAIVTEGASEFMFKANAMGYGFKGYYSTGLTEAWAKRWRASPDDLPDIAKFSMLFNGYAHGAYHGRHYGRAQNLRRALKAAYDRALTEFDVLAMPTTPFTATKLPGPEAGFAQRVTAGLDMEGNTAPFDVSGHPAISLPCGLVKGLPVGLMFIGPHFGESAVLRAAASFERLGDWKTL